MVYMYICFSHTIIDPYHRRPHLHLRPPKNGAGRGKGRGRRRGAGGQEAAASQPPHPSNTRGGRESCLVCLLCLLWLCFVMCMLVCDIKDIYIYIYIYVCTSKPPHGCSHRFIIHRSGLEASSLKRLTNTKTQVYPHTHNTNLDFPPKPKKRKKNGWCFRSVTLFL